MSQVIDKTGFCENKWDHLPIPSLQEYQGEPAIQLHSNDDVQQLISHFETLQLIVIGFDTFSDGRGFSQAARLRNLGYEKHIRARGHVLVDQFRAALRCGIDDVEISDQQARRNPEHQWQNRIEKSSYLKRLAGLCAK